MTLMPKPPPDRPPGRIVAVTDFFEALRTLDDGDSP